MLHSITYFTSFVEVHALLNHPSPGNQQCLNNTKYSKLKLCLLNQWNILNYLEFLFDFAMLF